MVTLDEIKNVNDEIYKMETYVLQREEEKEKLTEDNDSIETQTMEEVLEDKTFSNEIKRKIEIKKRLSELNDHKANSECINAIKQDVKKKSVDISYYKRIFKMMIAFKEDYK